MLRWDQVNDEEKGRGLSSRCQFLRLPDSLLVLQCQTRAAVLYRSSDSVATPEKMGRCFCCVMVLSSSVLKM